MIRKFAIDPKIFWDITMADVNILKSGMYPHAPRFGVSFPRSWKRQAYQSLQHLRSRLNNPQVPIAAEEFLKTMRLLCSRCGYDSSMTWIENIHQCLPVLSVQAAISTRARAAAQSDIISVDDLNEEDDRWRVPQNRECDERGFVEELVRLCEQAERCVVLSPYWIRNPNSDGLLLVPLLQKTDINYMDIHFCVHARDKPPSQVATDAEKRGQQLWRQWHGDSRHRLGIYGWEPRGRTIEIHERYVLTDVGGVRVSRDPTPGARKLYGLAWLTKEDRDKWDWRLEPNSGEFRGAIDPILFP